MVQELCPAGCCDVSLHYIYVVQHALCSMSDMSSLGTDGWYHLHPNKQMDHRPSPSMDFISAGVSCQQLLHQNAVKHKVIADDGHVTGNGQQEDTQCPVFIKVARVLIDRQLCYHECYYRPYSTPSSV